MNEIEQECRKLKPDFMVYWRKDGTCLAFLSEDRRASQLNQHKMEHVGHFNDYFREHIRGSNGELERKGYSNGAVEMIEAASHALCGCVEYWIL